MEHLSTPATHEMKPADASAVQDERQRKRATVQYLLTQFRIPPMNAGSRPCAQCEEGTVRTRDHVESAGGAAVFVSTLTYCDTCGDHEVGEPQWMSDY